MSKRTPSDIQSTSENKLHPVFGEVTVETLHPGNLVFCDSCGEDWTERKETGGFLFGSYAYCPECAPRNLARIKQYGEEWHIKARCPEGKSFADWVREDLR